jgi:hypothetical protein
LYTALVLVLALGAGLRFFALGWGLRHQPESDEHPFVENAARMASDHSLDHEYYFYPGLSFDIFAVVLGLRGTPRDPDPGAYLVVRGVLAAMSSASVGLVYLLGKRRIGVAAGLSAALFLAVSPVDVFVPHKVRPDAMLGTFALLALLALGSLGKSPRADALAGAALGAVSAVKFTAILLAPSVILSWLALPKRRWSTVAILCSVATLVFFAFTPYALVNPREFVAGMVGQFNQHYSERVIPYSQMLLVYLRVVTKAFGPVAALALVALPMAVLDWRRWAPLVAFPLAAILTFATSDVRHERFLAPALGVVAILAGGSIEWVARRRVLAATALALVAAAFPLERSLVQARDLSRPTTMDRVADWAAATLPPGARLLTLLPDLGLDTTRFEVVRLNVSPKLMAGWLAIGPYLARETDYVVANPRGPEHEATVRGLDPVFRAEPDSNLAGLPLAVFRVPDSLRPRYDRLSLSRVTLSASENLADLANLRDDRPDTAWLTEEAQHPGQWIEATWGDPVRVIRVTLGLGTKPQRWGRQLQLGVTLDGKTWKPVITALASGAIGEGPPGSHPTAQVLVIEPTCARGVRILQRGRSDRRWAVSDLAIDATGEQDRAPGRETSCASLP